jgi:hypothetical protein
MGDLDVNPVAITFNSIVNAWANSCDPSQQEGKLTQYWANSHDLSAGKRAECWTFTKRVTQMSTAPDAFTCN